MGKRRTEGREKRGQSKGDLGEVITTRGSLGLEESMHGSAMEAPMLAAHVLQRKKMTQLANWSLANFEK